MTRSRSLAFVALACSLAAPAAAHGSFPGKNGPLVVALDDDCQTFDYYLARIPWRGGEVTPFTERCDPQKTDEDQPAGYSHPDASPDGRSVLAVHDTYPETFVKVTMLDGGHLFEPVQLPDEAATGGSLFGASFAPNGRKFAFEADRPQNGYDGEPLWEVQLDGSGARKIREGAGCKRDKTKPCSLFENPRWSPDGRLIAVQVITYRPELPGAMQPGIWLIRARDGEPVRRLTKHGSGLDWAPDGRNIVYGTTYQNREGEGGASGGNLYVVSRDGKRKRKLVHRHGLAETNARWSPDGRWITWVSLDFTAGDTSFDVFPSLWTVRSGGGKPKLIQKLPEPYVEEGMYAAPHLTWLPAAS